MSTYVNVIYDHRTNQRIWIFLQTNNILSINAQDILKSKFSLKWIFLTTNWKHLSVN